MQLKKWLLLFLSNHNAADAATTISSDYNLDTLSSRKQINGIWKVKMKNNQKLALKVYTHRQSNFIETECQEFNVKLYVKLYHNVLSISFLH